MKDETDRAPISHVLDAMDAICEARATIDLLFYAAEGVKAGFMVRGAIDAQARLDVARDELEAARLALGGSPVAEEEGAW